MGSKPSNPFLTQGYTDERYFCNRLSETKTLLQTLENARNVTLISLRRMGKTGLIQHVSQKLKNTDYVYVDILHTSNLKEFTSVFGKAVVNQLVSVASKTIQQLTSIFRKFKPTMTLDPYSGQPVFEFNIQTQGESENTLEDIFAYLRKRKHKTVIAIDEFQQIDNYPEKKTAALLRGYVQTLTHIQFIFAGSQKHILTAMFSDASRPFYQSTQFLFLEKIPATEYTPFIQSNFKFYQKKINKELIEEILNWCMGHTFYVQVICHKVFMKTTSLADVAILNEVKLAILNENEPYYIGYKNLLSEQQWNLLRAIAKEEHIRKINKKEFLTQYHLSASGVQRSIKALTEREMVVEENDTYRIYDVFLGRWIQQNF